MKKLQILVVDDYEGNREVVAEFARTLGHAAITASDGQEAVELVSLSYFDLLITDRQMPGMFGEELIYRAKKIRPAMKTILMTGGSLSAETTAAISAAGCDAIFQKSIKIEELGKIMGLLFWK